MTDARAFKSVDQTMLEPYGHLEISVCPVSIFGKQGVVGHSVGVMNTSTGRGSRTGLDRAEAEAKAVLKAIRSYRRRNAALLAADTDGGKS